MSPRQRISALVSPGTIVTALMLGMIGSLSYGQTCQPEWTQCSPSSSPSARLWMPMVYYDDGENAMPVIYGGYPGTWPALNDTWGLIGNTWVLLHAGDADGPNPGLRYTHRMVYDKCREVVVLFGSYHGPSGPTGPALSDTWEGSWDGATWTWTQVHDGSNPGVDCPIGREVCDMAFDSDRCVTVLHGGFGDVFPVNTWEWDGTQWTMVDSGAGVGPGTRRSHGMVYDSASQMVLLYGGNTGGSGQESETWGWNGTSWTLLDDGTGNHPTALMQFDMAYDETLDRTVLFGGVDLSENRLDETWEWNGSGWTEVTAAGPSARHGTPVCYDAGRDAILLFGGGDHYVHTYYSDTWTYVGCEDCNGNGVPDPQDIIDGTSSDNNVNGIPDECDLDGDLNGDGCVDLSDLALLLSNYGKCVYKTLGGAGC